ncbi:PREDICTED: probable protein phosphatase 2C 14 [Tarenaya hassleriana]|uniref:probable protein phosphatase 2C 14 n=1 Tax=Tarenaya hassleriana TaxID=28532 RepID=UPI00053C6D1E|nr:PREDICTED: probable protein phosphatase 2C 14 [Tarenaya hassleriana]
MANVSSAMENRRNRETTSTFSAFSVQGMSSLKRKRPPQIEIPHVLQEIQPDKLKSRDFAHQNDTVCFSGNGFGVVSNKGKKKFMEDTHRVAPCLPGSTKKSFFGVYDGHGGRKAAEFVAENLHGNVLETMKNCDTKEEKEEAIKAAYLKTDQDFLNGGAVSGACCVTALIQGREIIVSNLGDCRAVLSRGGVAEALTTDHRAERDDERKRIENQGGYVEFHRGAWRVHGILSVSRSIGDAHLKNWVVAEPDTTVLDLTQDMEFLVLASDGLWEQVSDQEAVATVLEVLARRKQGWCNEEIATDTDENLICGLVQVSPSSKLRRISLVKQRKESIQSPEFMSSLSSWHDNENELPSEIGSPPSKSRKISLVKRVKMKTEPSRQENSGFCKSSASNGLTTACKELVSLAARRGSLDDITVMIIDLNHYKSSS